METWNAHVSVWYEGNMHPPLLYADADGLRARDAAIISLGKQFPNRSTPTRTPWQECNVFDQRMFEA